MSWNSIFFLSFCIIFSPSVEICLRFLNPHFHFYSRSTQNLKQVTKMQLTMFEVKKKKKGSLFLIVFNDSLMHIRNNRIFNIFLSNSCIQLFNIFCNSVFKISLKHVHVFISTVLHYASQYMIMASKYFYFEPTVKMIFYFMDKCIFIYLYVVIANVC